MFSSFSRRQFLERLGTIGGSAAIYQASLIMGLIPSTSQAAPHITLDPLGVRKRRVVILGAGISGLACAYELERAGYDCTLIEASHRIGGRNMTVRGGDTVDEMGNPQRCRFDNDPSLYFNAGPARIPAHHKLLLHYCKTLGVELEVFINVNRHAWVHDTDVFGGKPVRMQDYITDARGFMSELLTKSVNPQAFDQSFSNEDRERLFEFLKSYGDLDEKGMYRGSMRTHLEFSGSTSRTPLDFKALLKSSFWRNSEGMHLGEQNFGAAPLMQAVGGNDQIVRSFVRHIKSPIISSAPVQQITLKEDGVDVVYQHQGRNVSIQADYCLNSIPMHLLPGLHHNFPKGYFTSIASAKGVTATKVALQVSERFWEKEGIYGGMSSTNQSIRQLWYPSQGIHSKKGIMLGAYMYNEEDNKALARLTLEQRLQTVIEQGEKIHPHYGNYVEAGVSVPWHRMNHQMGCASFLPYAVRKSEVSRLQQPEGRHYLMGDQISDHPGWQEGALHSAHFVLAHLNQRVQAEAALHG